MTNLTMTAMKKATTRMMTHEQIKEMFSEESDDDTNLCLINIADFSASYTRVQLIHKYIR